jgi:hypothetical protein
VLRAILILAAIAAFIYAGLCLALFLAQRSFLYYPQPRPARNGSSFVLDAGGEKVLISTRPAGSDAVIYFGGNAEDVSQSLPTLAAAFPDRSLFAMNYRGYGGSTGQPSEAALVADALALFDRVHRDHPRIILIGRSLGSGVAVHLASERRIDRLTLVTPYDSIQNLAAAQFPFFPVRWLLTDKFESWRYAQKVTVPTHLIAAQNDEVIPAARTNALCAYFPPAIATLTTIPNVGHNDISESPQYIQSLKQTP